jgi:hypothetical protein
VVAGREQRRVDVERVRPGGVGTEWAAVQDERDRDDTAAARGSGPRLELDRRRQALGAEKLDLRTPEGRLAGGGRRRRRRVAAARRGESQDDSEPDEGSFRRFDVI